MQMAHHAARREGSCTSFRLNSISDSVTYFIVIYSRLNSIAVVRGDRFTGEALQFQCIALQLRAKSYLLLFFSADIDMPLLEICLDFVHFTTCSFNFILFDSGLVVNFSNASSSVSLYSSKVRTYSFNFTGAPIY